MKRRLASLLFIGILAVALAPLVVSAQAAIPDQCTVKSDRVPGLLPACPGAGNACLFDDPNTPCAVCCLLNTIINITDWIFMGLMLLVVLFVLIGAFNLMTAAGAPEKIQAGRNYILWAAIGLAAAFLARAVPNLVNFFIT